MEWTCTSDMETRNEYKLLISLEIATWNAEDQSAGYH
jgi:hypothetical protein